MSKLMVLHYFYPAWHILSKETKQEMCCATILLPSVMTEVCRKGVCTGCACPGEFIQTWENLLYRFGYCCAKAKCESSEHAFAAQKGMRRFFFYLLVCFLKGKTKPCFVH